MLVLTRPGWRLAVAAGAAMLAMSTAGAAPVALGAPPVHSAAILAPRVAPAAPKAPKITADLKDVTISRYGIATKTTLKVQASGSKLKYLWQHRPDSKAKWKTIKDANKASYTVKSSKWNTTTQFRVKVSNQRGKVTSKAVTVKVLHPTRTPARDAEKAFGFTGLRQGLDLSSYQYEPNNRIRIDKVASWAGKDGFVVLRLGSGARPVNVEYTDACTWKTRRIGDKPITRDCAYPTFAQQVTKSELSLGHYWFNGWIQPIDRTQEQLFANGYTPTDSAKQFVAWLKSDGKYTRSSTDPLVLDIEPGRTWTAKDSNGKKHQATLRSWTPAEAIEFLTVVREELSGDGYQANLYVYLSQNQANQMSNGRFKWADVARISRLWIARWGLDNGRIPAEKPLPGPWAAYGGWSIWQYSANVRISGSGVGPLDGDVAQPDAWTPQDIPG